MKIAILVFLGGGLGSLLRFLISRYLNQTLSSIPLGTFTVNVLGSFLLGLITGYVLKTSPNSSLIAFLSIGFCGGFTTFSTFSLENQVLLRTGDYFNFALYSTGSLVLGILAVISGLYLSRAI